MLDFELVLDSDGAMGFERYEWAADAVQAALDYMAAGRRVIPLRVLRWDYDLRQAVEAWSFDDLRALKREWIS